LEPPATLLEVRDLRAGYGAAVALDDISFDLVEGELLLLVGPNGAGKSTLMRVLIGVHKAWSGSISFEGRQVSSVPAHQRAKLGMAWIAEGRGIIRELSVEENLDVARFSHDWSAERREASLERFPILKRTLKRSAGTLSGGEQQMLAIARALETGPRLLLIDEPSLGLAPKIVAEVLELLGQLAEEGNSILLVEQRAAQVQHIATRIFLMRQGRIDSKGGRPEFTEMSFAEFSGSE
jgi:branched-chain amino acid transport system ATP-binding protein